MRYNNNDNTVHEPWSEERVHEDLLMFDLMSGYKVENCNYFWEVFWKVAAQEGNEKHYDEVEEFLVPWNNWNVNKDEVKEFLVPWNNWNVNEGLTRYDRGTGWTFRARPKESSR